MCFEAYQAQDKAHNYKMQWEKFREKCGGS